MYSTSSHKKKPVVLATIISHEGSTPRDTGTRIVIDDNGRAFGTIGGGLVEAQVIEAATNIFKTGRSTIIDYDMTQSHLEANSMICGGRMSTLLEHFEPTPENLNFFTTLHAVFDKREKTLLIVNLEDVRTENGTTSHAIILNGETLYSSFLVPFQTPVFSAEMQSELRGKRAITRTVNDQSCWVEALEFPRKLILFGAGHVARPTADLGSRT